MNNEPRPSPISPQQPSSISAPPSGEYNQEPYHGMVLQPLHEAEVLRERELNKPIGPPAMETPTPTGINNTPAPMSVPIERADLSPSAPLDIHEESLRFPWVRTLLIGMASPILFLVILIGLSTIIIKTGLLKITPGLVFAFPAAPFIVALVVIAISAKLLGKLRVNSPILISIGVLLFCYGAYSVFSTLISTPLGLQWGWQDETSLFNKLGLLLYGLIPFMGAIAIALLVLPTNFFKDKMTTFLRGVLLLVIVAAPYAANYIAERSQPSLAELMTSGYSLRTAGDERKTIANGNGWPLLPATTYPAYDNQKIEACLKYGLIVSGVLECDIKCAETIGGVCVDVGLISGKLLDEHRPYLYKNGQCDASSLGYVVYNVNSNGKLPPVSLRECRKLTTPEKRTVYGMDYGHQNLSNLVLTHYYITEGDAFAQLRLYIYNQPGAATQLSDSMVKRAEATLLGFVDTFEIVDRK